MTIKTQPYKIYGRQQKQFLKGSLFVVIQTFLKKQEKSQTA